MLNKIKTDECIDESHIIQSNEQNSDQGQYETRY